ncbi:hypothetical protein JRO89_XS02G0229200 [Xanthoceras sorbifolium]|uniref:RCC1-like domain-containing protein n=1 Tax=Xanthoceras sorbifolium TaxID=99658 RepID=A0ABQ8IHD1_9ROSI|nr:hypothetical protein JRO89_XS02G0229200 [Xanthoceras sorbifolium]
MNGDAFREGFTDRSLRAINSSSEGSGLDGGDSLADVFIWGEGTGDGILGGGIHRARGSYGTKTDSLVPKALESAVVLDVQSIACGERQAALVTKQGKVFTWGEELGGRLGHGVDLDISHPKLVNSLKNINIKLVACGELHSCAVTLSGDLYTWGRSAHNFGHANEVTLQLPKKLTGPLEGMHVSSVSCGPWHTAVVTSAGQLFTFGDGSFGVLGHGDRESVSIPREVESIKGLHTVRAACGVWHTAAVVAVMVGSSSSINCSSGKLFTWGDGDKNRLGHGEKDARLVPTCVATVVEHNFCQVACGSSLTVALTTTGHVYTMGSPVYGQLGDPSSDGKLPTRVEGKLTENFVEEIACGAYHVAVLTSRAEVYSWGKGKYGQLGHGDIDDRNSPSLIEALKDKEVKSIVCGTNFSAAICLRNCTRDDAKRTADGLSEEDNKLSAQSSHLGEVSDQLLIQRSVSAGSGNINPSNQSGSTNSLSISVREEDNEDDELRDHSASKITMDRTFVVINFIMEFPTAVFDQLSSAHKPQYALVSMLLSFMTMLICIIELVYKGGVERVAWRWREKIPWLYCPSPSHRPFGTVTDFIGMFCAISQFILATITYAHYLQHSDDPIKISLWPFFFASCLMCSKFFNNPHKKTL